MLVISLFSCYYMLLFWPLMVLFVTLMHRTVILIMYILIVICTKETFKAIFNSLYEMAMMMASHLWSSVVKYWLSEFVGQTIRLINTGVVKLFGRFVGIIKTKLSLRHSGGRGMGGDWGRNFLMDMNRLQKNCRLTLKRGMVIFRILSW